MHLLFKCQQKLVLDQVEHPVSIYESIGNHFVIQLIGGVLTHLTTAGAKKCISEEKEDIAQTLGITNK